MPGDRKEPEEEEERGWRGSGLLEGPRLGLTSLPRVIPSRCVSNV